MKRQLRMEQPLVLSIAGLGIQIACNDPGLLVQLCERYRGFSDKAGDSISVEIVEVERSGDFVDLAETISFRDEFICFGGPHVEGLIDLNSRRAELRFSSRYSLDIVEYFLRVILAGLAFKAGGMMFHAAGIVRHGQAYLFFGHSGSGKSTVARLSTDDRVLNDDLVVLLPSAGVWQVHATPFWNPSQVQPSPGSASLAGFFRLVQDKSVYLEPLHPGLAIAELVANLPVLPADPSRNPVIIERVQGLVQRYPCHRLHFLPDATFWQVIESAESLSGNEL